MLTKKNRAGFHLSLLLIVAGFALAGCKPPGAKALLAGKKLLDNGKGASAIESFQKATLLLPNNAQAWNYLGVAYHANNQPTEASKAYTQAIVLNPNLFEAHYNLGCLLLEQNNCVAAKGELTAYVYNRPRDINGWLRLASAQWRCREVANAERSYAEAAKLDPRNAEALNGLGMTQLAHNRPNEALQYFSAAARMDTNYAPAFLNLASLQHQYLGNKRAALGAYRDYLALNPPANSDAVISIVSQLEVELNPPPKPSPPAVAAAPAKPAPSIQPLQPTPKPAPAAPRPAVSDTPSKTQPDSATAPVVKTNRQVVVSPLPTPTPKPPPVAPNKPTTETVAPTTNLQPTSPLTLTNLPPVPVVTQAPAQITVLSNVPVRANADGAPTKPSPTTTRNFQRYNYRSLTRPKPGNRVEADRFFTKGLEAQVAKSLPDSLTAFRSAAQADPSYFKALYNLGWTAYAMKDWTTALDAYEMALAAEPESPDARYNFALTLKQANYPQDAVNELESLLAKRPNDGPAHLLLANLYAQQLASPRQARPHYLRVIELNPSHPQATQIRYWLSENPE